MMTIKLSWTTLKAWERGDTDDAISYYLGKPIPPSPAMELGSLKHEQYAAHILGTGRLPDEIGGREVSKPFEVEQFYGARIPFSDEYEIYIISKIDLHEPNIVSDWKFGKSSPGDHLGGRCTQLGYYQVALKANKILVNEGRFTCFNPYEGTYETGIQYLNDETEQAALEHILTFGGEMIEHLRTQNLLKDYDPDWMNKPASASQMQFMRSLGVAIPDGCTKGQASKLIDKAKEAR